jgi:hypothetical protein
MEISSRMMDLAGINESTSTMGKEIKVIENAFEKYEFKLGLLGYKFVSKVDKKSREPLYTIKLTAYHNQFAGWKADITIQGLVYYANGPKARISVGVDGHGRFDAIDLLHKLEREWSPTPLPVNEASKEVAIPFKYNGKVCIAFGIPGSGLVSRIETPEGDAYTKGSGGAGGFFYKHASKLFEASINEASLAKEGVCYVCGKAIKPADMKFVKAAFGLPDTAYHKKCWQKEENKAIASMREPLLDEETNSKRKGPSMNITDRMKQLAGINEDLNESALSMADFKPYIRSVRNPDHNDFALAYSKWILDGQKGDEPESDETPKTVRATIVKEINKIAKSKGVIVENVNEESFILVKSAWKSPKDTYSKYDAYKGPVLDRAGIKTNLFKTKQEAMKAADRCKSVSHADFDVVALHESVNEESDKLINWGFDLTDIKASKWAELMTKIGASKIPKASKTIGGSPCWEWKGTFMSIYTGNDPISGKYAGGAHDRDIEKDYASYIGMVGPEGIVKAAVKFIKDNGDYKDESPNKRSYI